MIRLEKVWLQRYVTEHLKEAFLKIIQQQGKMQLFIFEA